MSWPTHYDNNRNASYGLDGSNSFPIQIPTAASAHTKGAWTQLTAATDFDARELWIILAAQDQAAHMLVDIGIGAGGSETVLIPNLYAATNSSNLNYHRIYRFPVALPAGTRITARAQSSFAGTANIRIALMLAAGGWMQAYGGVEECGPDTAASNSVLVVPSATANTKGAWTQLTAATDRAGRALVVTAQSVAAYTGASASRRWRADLAVGAGGSEQIIVPDLCFGVAQVAGVTLATNWYVTPPLPVQIPAGTRIAARIQNSLASDPGTRIAAYLIS